MLKQYDDFQMELFNRVLQNKGNKSLSHDKYPPQLRAFAITLHFYSAKAFAYVRNKFNLALPHPSELFDPDTVQSMQIQAFHKKPSIA
ncbi:unnamed protein product, partial [Brenthis ino]